MVARLIVAGVLAIILSGAAQAQNAPLTDCDKLAAHPDDPHRKAPGIAPEKIDATQAVAACETAIKAYPSDPRLLLQLGRAYQKANNLQMALSAYQKAADQKYAPGESSLGFMYVLGLGVGKDAGKAFALFRKAADQGYAPAQANLATMYQQGLGVAKNSQEALKLYRLSADQKYALAELNLGIMYGRGDGVGKDEAQAASWFRLAAEQGNPAAQYNLGGLYAAGHGVAQNQLLAFMWSDLAAQKLAGPQRTQAENNREKAARLLSAPQVRQAEDMARQCEAHGFKACETLANAAAAAAQTGWQEYRSDEAGFRIEMPGTPRAGEQDLPNPRLGKMHYVVLAFEKGSLLVSYSEIASDRLNAPSEKALVEMRDLEIKTMKARLMSEQRETVGSFPALRVMYDPANGLIMTKRYVLVKSRIYQVAAVGPRGFSDRPDVQRFLNSFAVLTR